MWSRISHVTPYFEGCFQTTVRQFRIEILHHTSRGSECRTCLLIESTGFVGEEPAFITRQVLVVGDGGRFIEAVILIEGGMVDTTAGMADLFYLCHYGQYAVLYLLENVGTSVREVDVHITVLLVNHGLVTLRTEVLPCVDHRHNSRAVASRFNVEVTSIKPSALVEAWNKFEGFIRRPKRIALFEIIEMRRFVRSLYHIIEMRCAVPYTVSFFYGHVVHLYREPYIKRRMPHFVVNILGNREGIGLLTAVFQEVDAWFFNL